MTMQATLPIGANKTQVAFSAGAFVEPSGSGSISIYVNTADTYRDNEVRGCIEKLGNYIRENAVALEAAAVPIYLYMKIGDGKGQIFNDSSIAVLVAGTIGIGLAAFVPVTSSNQVAETIQQIRDAMWDVERIYA